jgi:prolyl-tRNA synthetase
MALLRGDDEIEDVKLLNLCQGHEIRLATAEEIHRFTGGASKGFVGPARLPQPMRIVGDQRVKSLKNFAMACNVVDIHLVNANWVRDIDLPSCIGDIRLVKTGEGCPACSSGTLEMTRGIEVGNIFKLGTKYSEKMEATYTDIDGTEKPFIMGCYGIGVSRTAAAAIERFHDRNGIVWPMALAPFQVVIVVANMGDEVQKSLAEEVYQSLQAAEVEVLLDDRDERAGVKFKDADLMGFPIRVTVGKKAGEGLLEVKVRDSQTPELLTPEALPAYLEHARKHWKPFQAMASV